jgi:hypothetical protein
MIYKGFTIEQVTDPWPLKYGLRYRFFIDEDDRVSTAVSLEDAKEQIDDLTD